MRQKVPQPGRKDFLSRIVFEIPCEEMVMEKRKKLMDEIFEAAVQNDMTYFG